MEPSKKCRLISVLGYWGLYGMRPKSKLMCKIKGSNLGWPFTEKAAVYSEYYFFFFFSRRKVVLKEGLDHESIGRVILLASPKTSLNPPSPLIPLKIFKNYIIFHDTPLYSKNNFNSSHFSLNSLIVFLLKTVIAKLLTETK